ncbi:MAG: hypothetical protein IPM46_00780 [Flavobacteriales bacterium]|nr:hypothetical protein [Flavobacteriales bacterium]
MNIDRIGALLIIAALALASCKRENKVPILRISPSNHDIDMVSGDVVTFGIQCSSDNSTLARLVIKSKRGNGFTMVVIDSTLSGNSFRWDWEYQAAHATASYTELLTFELIDADGEQMSTTRALYVTLTQTVLVETSGHLFYSRNSPVHPESAFDLQDRVQVLYTADSTRRDMQDNPSGTDEVLSRSWISPAGGRFVRFNGFDYANATDVALRNAYLSGVPAEQLSDIEVGDIIITKLGSLPPNIGFYAVVRITGIVDEAGTADNDRYQFNLKWASFTE